MSFEISTDSRPICQPRYVGRHIEGHIGSLSVDMSADTSGDISVDMLTDPSVEYRSICRPIAYRRSADTSLLLAFW